MFVKRNSGQALLIILLVMAVILTISLAVVSRSITDLKVSRQEDESARVFSVAEAGIEQAILTSTDQSGSLNGVDYQVICSPEGNQSSFDFGGARFAQGSIQTLWLVGHTGDALNPAVFYQGSWLKLSWGNQGQVNDATAPALEATLYYKDGSVFKVARYAFDANAARGNGFSVASYDSAQSYPFQATIASLPGGVPYALRLKLIYNTTEAAIKVEGNAVFPSQGDCCNSTAVQTASGVTRKVRQCRFYKSPPGIFDYVLFSGGDLNK